MMLVACEKGMSFFLYKLVTRLVFTVPFYIFCAYNICILYSYSKVTRKCYLIETAYIFLCLYGPFTLGTLTIN